jgi:hypothetical protein
MTGYKDLLGEFGTMYDELAAGGTPGGGKKSPKSCVIARGRSSKDGGDKSKLFEAADPDEPDGATWKSIVQLVSHRPIRWSPSSISNDVSSNNLPLERCTPLSDI